MKQFYQCRCFLTNNIFLRDFNLHVSFINDNQFWREYGPVLKHMGCDTEAKKQEVISKIQEEVHRRQSLAEDSRKRIELIRNEYHPLHSHVYKLDKSYLHPRFLNLSQKCLMAKNFQDVSSLLEVISSEKKLYAFPVFTESFTKELLEEVTHFENSSIPKGRPNTMNNYGVLLNELGFDDSFLDPLRHEYIQPIARVLFPEWGGGDLDSHRAFTVKYKMDEDVDLSYHYDNAEVTLNICLGKDFTGGELYFGDIRDVPTNETTCTVVEHRPTIGIMHRGQHLHGALPISEGERHNLIIWMRSSRIRNRKCPMCDQRPSLVPADGYGDGFTSDQPPQQTVNVCALH